MPMMPARLPRFRLRTLLLLVNLFVLIVPLGSIYAFRLYENELVRQTESELIVQGAFVSALYKQAIAPLLTDARNYGLPVQYKESPRDEKYTPIEPALDLSRIQLLPPRPDAARAGAGKPDAAALQAAQSIFPVLDSATLTTLAGIRLIDYHGIVVGGREEKGLSLAGVEEIDAALKGKYTAVVRQRISKHDTPPLESLSRGTNIRIFVAIPMIAEGRVLGVAYLSRSPRNIMKGLFDNLQEVEIAGGIILTITIALALLTSYAISRPIYALIGQTQRIGRGETIRPITAPVTREIALLSENIAQMAETIAQRSDYIRNFAMHVSHEFKTPLTAIQGAIELIQEHASSMSPEQLDKFLSNTSNDTERLGRLVTRLLEMARADVLQARQESCDFAVIFKELQQRYRDKHLAVTFTLPGETIVPLPSDILQTVLTNLFENSLQHGATEITAEVLRGTQEIHITVKDNGGGISPANAEKLFVPFFTTSRDTGGTGLGLVIIRSMLNAYHAGIVHLPLAKGTGFVIRIPIRD